MNIFSRSHRNCLILLLLCLAGLAPATQVLFVSPAGDDAWSGEFAEPLADRSDGPLATPHAAQARARAWIADASRPREDILITFRAGDYRVHAPLVLTEADSGIGPAPVTWQAWPGESVTLDGGLRVTGFQRLADSGIPARIPAAHRGEVYVVDLHGLGIDFSEPLEKRDFYDLDKPGPLQVYYRDELMTLARYPNDGWVRIAGVPQDGATPVHKGHHADKRDGTIPTGRHYGAITCADDRPASWASVEDVWMHGYWTWDWADSTQRIERLDPAARRITIAGPHHRYGYTAGQRYYYFNIPEELDAPGEWYLDRASGHLFFWPPGGHFTGELVLARFTGSFFTIRNARHLAIKGFNMAYSRGPAIRIGDSEAVAVADCRFFCLGGQPVTIEGGRNCGVSGSEFTELSAGAIVVSGGDRATLEPAGHYVVDNHLHDFSKVYRANHPGIKLLGVGNRAAHNLIHDAPHSALLFTGNDHLIEYNEIHDIAKETGDVGAIYIGRDYTSRGSIVRYNYLHHLLGPGLHGVRGVYLDDFTSGIVVFGNVFHKAGRAAFIGGGRDNRIQNNLFIDCEPSVQIDGRGLSWANHHFDQDHAAYASTLRDFYAAANVTRPPYAVRYPELQKLYDDDPKVPKGNVVENNLSFGGIFLDLYDGVDLRVATVRHNLVADPVALRMTAKSDQDPDFTVYPLGAAATRAILGDNLLLPFASPPYRFVDGRVQLDLHALPAGTGFLPIPVEAIGRQPQKES